MPPKDYTVSRYSPVSWDQLHRDTRTLAELVIPRRPFAGIVAVTRGGLIPASIIARELDLRVIDCVAIASYDDRAQSGLQVLKAPDPALCGDGSGWLVIDDLVDSGVTARAVKGLLPAACLATVYAKPEGQQEADLFAVAVPQDVWVLFPWDAALQPNDPLVRRRTDTQG